MRHDEIPSDLRSLAFEFFYWFSRFEFALKENGYLKKKTVGANAEPGWESFVKQWQDTYALTAAANALIAANPQRQVVSQYGLEFRPVGLDHKPSELGIVTLLARTVRNNLFHGGKHGDDMWDSPARMRELLPLVNTILGELAEFAGIENDYRRYY